MGRKSLVLMVGRKFPFIYGLGFKKQWDMEKQPYFCLFIKSASRTDRIFEL